jgi:hypothetical protein
MGDLVPLVRDPGLASALAALLLMMVATTATFLVAAGAAWPDFREANADALSTSGAGLGATVACLGYGAFMGWIAQHVVLATAEGRGDGDVGGGGGRGLGRAARRIASRGRAAARDAGDGVNRPRPKTARAHASVKEVT